MSKSLTMTAAAAAAMALMAGTAHAAATEADRSFLTQDVQGARYELALAKLGETKATKPAIRKYATMVASDHMKVNPVLLQLAKQEGVDAPGGMTAKDEAMLTKVKAMSGSDFNRTFVDEMNRINAEDKNSADQEKASTQETAISSYIRKFASMDAKHKQMAAELRSDV